MEVLDETLALAAEVNVPVMLDPAPALPLNAPVLRRLAWLTPNETEAAILAGSEVPETAEEIRAFAEALHGSDDRGLLAGDEGVR